MGLYNVSPGFPVRGSHHHRQSKEIILNYERKRQALLPPSEQSLWIGKPSDSSRGRGILLTKDLDSFLDSSQPVMRKSMEVAVQLAKGDLLAVCPITSFLS